MWLEREILIYLVYGEAPGKLTTYSTSNIIIDKQEKVFPLCAPYSTMLYFTFV
jgi:hypothetical protein